MDITLLFVAPTSPNVVVIRLLRSRKGWRDSCYPQCGRLHRPYWGLHSSTSPKSDLFGMLPLPTVRSISSPLLGATFFDCSAVATHEDFSLVEPTPCFALQSLPTRIFSSFGATPCSAVVPPTEGFSLIRHHAGTLDSRYAWRQFSDLRGLVCG